MAGSGRPPGVQPPYRDPQRRRTGAGLSCLQPVGLRPAGSPAPADLGMAAPDHLAVQRVGQAHLRRRRPRSSPARPVPATRAPRRERRSPGSRAPPAGTGPAAPRPSGPAADRPPIRCSTRSSSLLVAGKRALQVPHARPLDQRPRLERAQHQLAHVERVAPGDLPELPARAGLDRAAQARGAGAYRAGCG